MLFYIEGEIFEVVKWVVVYGIFYWGLLVWVIYFIFVVFIVYFYYVCNYSVFKIFEVLMLVIGEKMVYGWLGKIIDISFIFGMLGGGVIIFGLVVFMINEGVYELFGVFKLLII